jgi:septation ring formation regulator EzrA
VFKNGAVFQINTIKSRINTVEEAVKKVTGKYFKIKCIEDKSEAAESTEKNAFDDMTRKVIDIFGGEIIPT